MFPTNPNKKSQFFITAGARVGPRPDLSLENVSLTASQSQFFITEAVFTGARVGPSGIRPDLSLENVDGVIEPGRFHWNLRRTSVPLLRVTLASDGLGEACDEGSIESVTLWRGCARKNRCRRSSD